MHTPGDTAPWEEVVELFNREEFIACVLALETFWFTDRSDFFKGLIRTCVALNQLRLGLLTSPRFLLTTAHELLEPFEPSWYGVDVAELRHFQLRWLEAIPGDKETGEGAVDWHSLPKFRL